MMGTASEQEYKVEVYHDRPIFETACFGTLENAARESLGPDGSVREVRLLDHDGKRVETLGKGAE